jgi:hypothetical protein
MLTEEKIYKLYTDALLMPSSKSSSGFMRNFARMVEEASTNEWKDAVIDELVCAYILTKEHETNPRKAIQDAIEWNCMVALDPRVSSEAEALIERGRNER